MNRVSVVGDDCCRECRLVDFGPRHLPTALSIDLLEGGALGGKCAVALAIEFRQQIEILFPDIEFPESLADTVGDPGIILLSGRNHSFERVCRPAGETEGCLNLFRMVTEGGSMRIRKKLPDGWMLALEEGGLKLNDGFDDSVCLRGPFRRKNSGVFKRRQHSHDRADIHRRRAAGLDDGVQGESLAGRQGGTPGFKSEEPTEGEQHKRELQVERAAWRATYGKFRRRDPVHASGRTVPMITWGRHEGIIQKRCRARYRVTMGPRAQGRAIEFVRSDCL